MNTRSYVKLFSSIVTSSLWSENSDTRVVWVTMLALSDQYSEVHASIPGLARAANVPRKACEKALANFLAPDRDSRTKDHEGRRIAEIDGGWKILNGLAYKQLMSIEERREYKRIHEAERRQKLKARGHTVDSDFQTGTNVTHLDTDLDKETSTKLNKGEKPRLSKKQKEVGARFGLLLINGQWANDRGKWWGRIRDDVMKCERVVAEVERAAKDGRIDTTPAQYAEHIWKEFS